MLAIKGSQLRSFPVLGLKRVRDLMWLDGPLLCEYVHPRGDRYLYCWSDCDEFYTRWMVLRVQQQSLLRLASGKVPLDHIIVRACQDDFVYFIDIKAGKKKEAVTYVSNVADVPLEYLPKKGVFLDEPEELGDGRYSVLLDGAWNPTELFAMPKNFEQAYSFLHAHAQLQVPRLENLPWRGGISSVHFDRWVRNTIPSTDRLGLDKVMLASPGFIEFTGSDETASMVARCVSYICESRGVANLYTTVTNYISKNLKQYEVPDAEKLQLMGPQLEAYTRLFAQAIGVIDPDRLLGSVKSSYEAVQILRWFYRRLKPMVDLQLSGKLQFMDERSLFQDEDF